ncbi:hypothetical protein SAMN06265337_1925 [Hymenobacter gelipurpurascens]|uniref:Uncharacterized protein n=1 Tax=Hymenobacter gelipurpurascens TaxID=89968 RepID=A0A212TNH0_9BACT|nr:hypothetical protein [Hymenobacter gelipurpurascens]SNC67364.1 hypothetical protein SAMN06265337_1925 [Hymenobacter gelipurpurascens]
MTTRTEQIAETAATKEGMNIRLWVLAGVVAGLLLFVQALMTFVMTSAAAKMDSYSKGLSEVLTAVQVMNARNEALTQRVAELEKAKAEANTVHSNIDIRLRSVEQRAAIHDQYMTSNK